MPDPDDMVLVRRDDLRAMLRAVEVVPARHVPPMEVLRNVRAAVNGEAASEEYGQVVHPDHAPVPIGGRKYGDHFRHVGPWVPVVPPVKPEMTRWERKQIALMQADQENPT